MDLHQKEIQGFFTFPVDNLRASPFLLQYIQEEVGSIHSQKLHFLIVKMINNELIINIDKLSSSYFCFA